MVGGRDNVRYSEIDNTLDGQILESPYKDVELHSYPKDDSFIHTFIFYKVFYIFMIGSVFGCYMEQIQYYIQRDIWECRAGVIWGPFSEIYGIGAVLIFLLYKKIKSGSPLTIFSLSAVCGSAFEYIARLFQEIAFHSITWDYSKQPFNIGGRTSLKYAIYWGILGLIFMKGIFPILEKQLENIKGRLAFAVTCVLIIFMSINLVFSAIAVNRWSERLQNVPSNGNIDDYMDNYYNNDEMKQLFPHMKFLDITK
jgi:uncharacterized membrane protein